MTVSFTSSVDFSGPAIVAGLAADGAILAPSLGKGLRDSLERAVEIQRACGRFTGKLGEAVEVIAPQPSGCRRLIGICVGDPAALDGPALERVGGAAAARLSQSGELHGVIAISAIGEAEPGEQAARIAFGAVRRNYIYRIGRTRPPEPTEPVRLERLEIVTSQCPEAEVHYRRATGAIKAIHLARDFVNEPPNLLYPASFVEKARSLTSLGIEVEALEPDQLRELGMNALLAVGEGSAYRPRLLILRWNGAKDPAQRPVALVGKGITFDSGGLNTKTIEWMKGMKGDMAGGAAVVAAISAAARDRLPVNLVGVVPLAENAVSGSSYRPSDVVRAACGVSIEIGHTDAEGRLVLIDGIWFARARLEAERIVSIGTVTGSGIFGLGRHYAGLYSADEALATELTAAGQAAAEPLWRLPFSDAYDEDLLSDIADYKQMAPFMHGADGTYVSRLLRHAAGDIPWAQIEMAGLEFTERDTFVSPKGATGFGARLLSQFATSLKPPCNEGS